MPGSPRCKSLRPVEGQLMQTPAGVALGGKPGPYLTCHLLHQLQRRASQATCWQLGQKKAPSRLVCLMHFAQRLAWR